MKIIFEIFLSRISFYVEYVKLNSLYSNILKEQIISNIKGEKLIFKNLEKFYE